MYLWSGDAFRVRLARRLPGDRELIRRDIRVFNPHFTDVESEPQREDMTCQDHISKWQRRNLNSGLEAYGSTEMLWCRGEYRI